MQKIKDMKWQDIAFTIISIAFCYSLIPQIVYNTQLHCVNLSWQTVIISAIGLYASAFCFLTLKFYFTTIFSATCWLVMVIQKIIL